MSDGAWVMIGCGLVGLGLRLGLRDIAEAIGRRFFIAMPEQITINGPARPSSEGSAPE